MGRLKAETIVGIEDFGVILRPVRPLLASSAECELFTHGFVASGGTGLPHERTYVLGDRSKNIEAMLRGDSNDDTLLSCLSIRYAVCQPEAATQAFLDIVTQAAEKFCLEITGLAPGVEFSCDTLTEFQEYAKEKVKQAKSRWSSLFAGDTEEVVVSVAESWKYFIAKHPEVMQSKRVLVR